MGCLNFHPLTQPVVHALKGLARLASGLLAHAEVPKSIIIFFSVGPNLSTPWYAMWFMLFAAPVMTEAPGESVCVDDEVLIVFDESKLPIVDADGNDVVTGMPSSGSSSVPGEFWWNVCTNSICSI